MKARIASPLFASCFAAAIAASPGIAGAQVAGKPAATPVSPYASWKADAPGVLHRFTANDMQPPTVTAPVANVPKIVPQPAGAQLAVPPGFKVTALRTGLVTPRVMRFAPNGDLFVTESKAGRVTVLHMADHGTRVVSTTTFATGLDWPFGLAFWPPGPNPTYLYVGTWDRIVRFPYHDGDGTARGPAETVVPNVPGNGHWTRDVDFTANGKHLFVSVGSESNDAETTMPKRTVAQARAYDALHGMGAAWGQEAGRATVLVTTPTGYPVAQYANGLRNCVGMTLAPDGRTPWCAVNEHDQRGNFAPADYVTSVRKGAFYGWPWFYIGSHVDPIHLGERPDLVGHVTVPDVLFPAHSAPLELVFYTAGQFPASYRGDIFVTMHGSCCRAGSIIGYKVVRALMKNGHPTGDYEDFLTGFVIDERHVWGRPVGVTVAPDGSLLVSDDGSGTIWRVSYQGGGEAATTQD